GGCASASNCRSAGDYGDASTSTNRFYHWAEAGTTQIRVELRCGRSSGCPRVSGGPAAAFKLFQSAISIRDDLAPSISPQPSGLLLARGQRQAGIRPVVVAASDQGGGLSLAIAEVKPIRDANDSDYRVIAAAPFTSNSGGPCEQPFMLVVPCTGRASTSI